MARILCRPVLIRKLMYKRARAEIRLPLRAKHSALAIDTAYDLFLRGRRRIRNAERRFRAGQHAVGEDNGVDKQAQPDIRELC